MVPDPVGVKHLPHDAVPPPCFASRELPQVVLGQCLGRHCVPLLVWFGLHVLMQPCPAARPGVARASSSEGASATFLLAREGQKRGHRGLRAGGIDPASTPTGAWAGRSERFLPQGRIPIRGGGGCLHLPRRVQAEADPPKPIA